MMTERRTVILDDDPTGTQSACGVEVLFSFAVADFVRALSTRDTVYVLTNTRSLDEAAAVEVVDTVRRRALAAADELGVAVSFVLRGDSTLRGHVFAESGVFMGEDAVLVFCPAFPDGGRVTRHGIHYLVGADGVERPVHLTEYAQDPVFGFTTSDLVTFTRDRIRRLAPGSSGAAGEHLAPQPDWDTRRGHVRSVDRQELQSGALPMILATVPPGTVVIPDAESADDIVMIADGVRAAEGVRPVVVRSAAPLAAELGGVASSELMAYEGPVPRRVLVVCGSHTGGATAQLDAVNAIWPGRAVIDTQAVFCGGVDGAYATRVSDQISMMWAEGPVAVLSTERVRRPGHNTLAHGAAVMEALIDTVRLVAHDADIIISKGGITSADVARRGLDGRSAEVLGQLDTGISMWMVRTGAGDRQPLVVVPGNVGDDLTLVRLLQNLGVEGEAVRTA